MILGLLFLLMAFVLGVLRGSVVGYRAGYKRGADDAVMQVSSW